MVHFEIGFSARKFCDKSNGYWLENIPNQLTETTLKYEEYNPKCGEHNFHLPGITAML